MIFSFYPVSYSYFPILLFFSACPKAKFFSFFFFPLSSFFRSKQEQSEISSHISLPPPPAALLEQEQKRGEEGGMGGCSSYLPKTSARLARLISVCVCVVFSNKFFFHLSIPRFFSLNGLNWIDIYIFSFTPILPLLYSSYSILSGFRVSGSGCARTPVAWHAMPC